MSIFVAKPDLDGLKRTLPRTLISPLVKYKEWEDWDLINLGNHHRLRYEANDPFYEEERERAFNLDDFAALFAEIADHLNCYGKGLVYYRAVTEGLRDYLDNLDNLDNLDGDDYPDWDKLRGVVRWLEDFPQFASAFLRTLRRAKTELQGKRDQAQGLADLCEQCEQLLHIAEPLAEEAKRLFRAVQEKAY